MHCIAEAPGMNDPAEVTPVVARRNEWGYSSRLVHLAQRVVVPVAEAV